MGKSIMIQGTMSNAGKSLITAGLCRIFAQDGYKTAPFKSQNMALNSYVTEDNLEIGRAQAVQAEAAGQKPSVFMNPILLKPTTDMGSQVIVNGEVRANMSASAYYKYKKSLIPEIINAYNILSKSNDIIVIEGAGSPAEINLNSNDFVNMGLAAMVKAPVLLAADIDRGGVFAQLYGTIALLDKTDQSFLKGMIVNKFRGDRAILEPGLDMFRKRLKDFPEMPDIPFVGVIPYAKLDIDDEDSLSTRLSNKAAVGAIDIAVVRLPKISNYTDMAPFERFLDVTVRYVENCNEFGNPDLIIIPGSKSTIADLLWLRENGLETLIKKYANVGVPVIGICGGFQMMGESLIDSYGVESDGSRTYAGNCVRGMELLPLSTTFEIQKTRKQVHGRITGVHGIFCNLENQEYTGYEIHMGKSTLSGEMGIGSSDLADNIINSHKNNYGTYVHGIFDESGIAENILEALCLRKGINADFIRKGSNRMSIREYKESQYDLLADILRESLDIQYIYEIIEKGI